jgi:hypothetical protein
MAAFPMVQAPVFSEFKNRLKKEFDTDYKTQDGMHNGAGEHIPIKYFERTFEGKTYSYVIDFPDENERIANWTIKSICKKLRIPLKPFGLEM